MSSTTCSLARFFAAYGDLSRVNPFPSRRSSDLQALEAAGARIWEELCLSASCLQCESQSPLRHRLSAPQLKRGPLGSTFSAAHVRSELSAGCSDEESRAVLSGRSVAPGPRCLWHRSLLPDDS